MKLKKKTLGLKIDLLLANQSKNFTATFYVDNEYMFTYSLQYSICLEINKNRINIYTAVFPNPYLKASSRNPKFI